MTATRARQAMENIQRTARPTLGAMRDKAAPHVAQLRKEIEAWDALPPHIKHLAPPAFSWCPFGHAVYRPVKGRYRCEHKSHSKLSWLAGDGPGKGGEVTIGGRETKLFVDGSLWPHEPLLAAEIRAANQGELF